MPEIRPFIFTDLNAVTEIYVDEVLNGTASYETEAPSAYDMRSRFAMLVANGFPVLVVIDGEKLLGFAYVDFFRKRPAYRWTVENSIYVARDARGRGLGRKLLMKLVEHCSALGFRQMIAVIGDGAKNDASINLHRYIGFEQCGYIKGSGFKHGRWLDTVLMQLPLNGGVETLPQQAAKQ